ncbi:MAG: FliM/FliN family flagellar motor C-terminal domain-containing protein [Pseudomonadota bacterium]
MVYPVQNLLRWDMTDSIHTTLLRRMTRAQDAGVAENPLTTSRAVRLALTKAANDTVGLSLAVQSVAEETASLDQMLADLPEGLMLLRLGQGEAPVGLAAIDMQLRAAVVEMETVGALIDAPADDRRPTRTDQVMVEPMISSFLRAFPEAVAGTALAGWADGVMPGERYADTREAGLILADCPYRILQMRVELGVADREGLFIIALPLVTETAEETIPAVHDLAWDEAFPLAVSQAPARLDALLHRFSIPLAKAQALAVGTVLPLKGCSVEDVRLLSDNGKAIATAKLGQMGGMRAVRLQAPPVPALGELGSKGAELPEMAASDPAPLALNDEGFNAPAMAEPDEMEFLADPMLDDAAPLPDLPGDAT